MSLYFKAKVQYEIKAFSECPFQKELQDLDRKMSLKFPQIINNVEERKKIVSVRKIFKIKKQENISLLLFSKRIDLEIVLTLIHNFTVIHLETNAENFILYQTDKHYVSHKYPRTIVLNKMFPQWFKIAKSYYSFLALVRNNKSLYSTNWQSVDTAFLKCISLYFLNFSKFSKVLTPSIIVCPNSTIQIDQNVLNNLPRNFLVKHFSEVITIRPYNHITIETDFKIAKMFFSHALCVFDGARVSSNTGSLKNIVSKIGPEDKNGNRKNKEKRHPDTLLLIRTIFFKNLYDGEKHFPREISPWSPCDKKHNELARFLKQITWEKRKNYSLN